MRRGLVTSRTSAAEAIRQGRVTVCGAPAASPARQVRASDDLHVAGEPDRFVSRGGAKLAGALDAFGVDPSGRRCLDAGASTGGFTDCLLQRGAASVIAVDVGRGQIAWTLRSDPRVEVRERVNVRQMREGDIDPPPDLVVADLSFISLTIVAPALRAVARDDAEFVLLVKPQFEAGPARVGKGGVVRDPAVHKAVLRETVAGLDAGGLGVLAVEASSLRGADGNVEFFAHARSRPARVELGDLDAVVDRVYEGSR